MPRINGENIARAALLFFSRLFLAAGMGNPVVPSVREVFYVLVASGIGLVFLGCGTYKNEQRVTAVH